MESYATKKEVFVTFDDSPTPKFTYWILNLLSKLKIKSTFFCIGKYVEVYPEVIHAIQLEEHT